MIPQIVLIVFCIFFAYANYRAIRIDARIRHAINGVFVSAFIGFFAVEYYKLHGFWYSLKYVFINLLLARAIFDTFLNLFRFHKLGIKSAINYVSLKPTSIVDKFEKKVFGYNGILPKVIYLILAVGLILIK